MKTLFFLISLLVLLKLNCAEQIFISHPDQPEKQIEFFFLKPEGDGPFPLLLLLHGYQPLESSSGGKQLVDFFYSERFKKNGIATASISVPGYGLSDGPRDYAGPYSQSAVKAVIDYLKKLPCIDRMKMGIYGISKGAVLASMVCVDNSDLSLQILDSGVYDLTTRRQELPDYLRISFMENLILETGGSDGALIQRSSVCHTDHINQKTLILQGEFDDRRGLPSARVLHQRLNERGVTSILEIFPGRFHDLRLEKWSPMIRFLREHFFGLVGIGISTETIGSIFQISQIYLDSAADRSDKIYIGDVILGISPKNDAIMIDAYGMLDEVFIAYVLGEKGTQLRLRVQHFDQSIEEIVLVRGS
jgi:dipeptidyl aminopeptidase/acylaminoacyl peptidase